MLRAEEKEHNVLLEAVMFGKWFYNGTDVSDSDTKLSDEKEVVLDVSQAKKAFMRRMPDIAAAPAKASTLVEMFKEEGLEL